MLLVIALLVVDLKEMLVFGHLDKNGCLVIEPGIWKKNNQNR